MSYGLSPVTCALLLLVGMIVCGEVGRYLAHRRQKRDPANVWQGIGVVDGAVFGLLGLIVAFSFSGAATRFDARRALIVDEVNALGTAYLRLDLLPEAARPAVKDKFRQYVDSRIRVYALFPDTAAVTSETEKGKFLQAEIWTLALSGAAGSQPATMLLLPALNATFDIATTRTMAMFSHPPPVIFILLSTLALLAAAMAGFSLASSGPRHWFHAIGLSAVTAIAFYVILDLEYPRLGYIQIEHFDEALDNLRKSMK